MDIERHQYEKSEELIQKLTRSRDEVRYTETYQEQR
jgi:hypothetical protein